MFEDRIEEMARLRDQQGTYLESLHLGPHGKRSGVFTSVAIPKGATILRLQGDLLRSPNRYSLQIDNHLHLDKGGLIDDEMNHSCDANAKIEFSDLTLRAIKDIEVGEEIRINYCTTEEVLAEPFLCDCGSKNCYRNVKGFRFLSPVQQRSLGDDISPYLQKRYR